TRECGRFSDGDGSDGRNWWIVGNGWHCDLDDRLSAVHATGGEDDAGGVSFRGLIFFFQAEDGIRGYKVTGVQTCALPIWSAPGGHMSCAGRIASHVVSVMSRNALDAAPARSRSAAGAKRRTEDKTMIVLRLVCALAAAGAIRSEERRVGKECRTWWSAELW